MLELLLPSTSEQPENKSISLWLLDMRKPCLGSLPAFHSSEKHAEESLDVAPLFSEGCRLWVGGQNQEVIRKVLKELRACDPMQLLEKIQKPEDTASAPSTEDAPPQEAPSNEAEPTTFQPTEVVIEENGREEGEVVDSGDTVMSDAQDASTEPPPAQPLTDENRAPANTTSGIPRTRKREVLCFIKVFDWENQTLRSLKSFSAPITSRVVDRVKKAMGVDPKPKSDETMKDSDQPEEEEIEWDIYHERFQFTKTYDLVTASATFEQHTLGTEFLPGDVQIIVPTDGACFIAQRRPSAEQYVPSSHTRATS